MIFPATVDEEDMPTRMKEWRLSGYSALMHPNKDKIYVGKGRRLVLRYVLGVGRWVRFQMDWRGLLKGV